MIFFILTFYNALFINLVHCFFVMFITSLFYRCMRRRRAGNLIQDVVRY